MADIYKCEKPVLDEVYYGKDWNYKDRYGYVYNGYTYARKHYAYLVASRDKGRHSKEEWKEMVGFFNFVCCKCESEVIGGVPTKDHIIPPSWGGCDSIFNLQPLCRECNASKWSGVGDYRFDYCERNNLILPEKWINNFYTR